jgi:hypothetical protein
MMNTHLECRVSVGMGLTGEVFIASTTTYSLLVFRRVVRWAGGVKLQVVF